MSVRESGSRASAMTGTVTLCVMVDVTINRDWDINDGQKQWGVMMNRGEL